MLKTRTEKLLVAIPAFIILAAALLFIVTQQFTSWDFRNNLWGPAHLLVTGRSPYKVWELFAETYSNAVWMPTSIGTFFPLGYLSETYATNLWFVLTLGALAVIFGLSMQTRRPSPIVLGGALLAAVLFPPVIRHLPLGQFSMLATLLMLLAVYFLDRPVIVALLVVLAAAKPQLILLPAFGLLVAVYRRGSVGGAARFIAGGAIWAIMLTLPLWLAYPEWLPGIQEAFVRNSKVLWQQPSLYVVAPTTFGTPGLILWGAAFLTALGITAYLWMRTPPENAMRWSLALNVLVSPYIWTWDFVLLLPLLINTLFRLRTIRARLLWLFGYAVCWGLMIHINLTTENSDGRYWWFPWVTVVYLGAAYLLENRKYLNHEDTKKHKEKI